METSPQDAAGRARAQQQGWYGESLGELFRGLMDALGLNQARLAALLGLSAPMLSQLMSGHRAKIGNPAVVARLAALRELAGEVTDGRVTAQAAAGRMAEIRASAGSALAGTGSVTTAPTAGQPLPPRRVAREIQALLRSLSSADGLLAAAGALAADHPELAEFLRVYGTGRTDEAVAHFEAHQD
ncbi:helix-turn-helix transcriptional regulator [Streptomyces sp. SL13]|jgi:transcriptional regulator with XRE-family HTH domain|uniref:Helix-turn-helix transcriptional regulator n=1 Tax=Streptantibioticus silvisoli TaxID=2705255 RepID=A0AA90K985_9ACTN|nr:helix-turn-helix transcriptional regulator [Streptantibioticus silvisoli]MDI5964326.1 helix-turn-helix transcriptional regulator [Streptantibioticus silvisoli]MDI5970572.1 helix-turn-helix transcriptional regulator [Streptantibioticus silvisoli]